MHFWIFSYDFLLIIRNSFSPFWVLFALFHILVSGSVWFDFCLERWRFLREITHRMETFFKINLVYSMLKTSAWIQGGLSYTRFILYVILYSSVINLNNEQGIEATTTITNISYSCAHALDARYTVKQLVALFIFPHNYGEKYWLLLSMNLNRTIVSGLTTIVFFMFNPFFKSN